jgi:hypothetical protein
VSKQTTSDQRRPPRNRTLLESVQTHLTLNSRTHSAGNETLAEKRPHKQNFPRGESSHLRESSAVPSLLARMSDASQAMALVPDSASVILSQNITAKSLESPRFEPPVVVQTRMTAPEIMARTRARLAKNGEATASMLLPTIQSQAVNSSSYLGGRQEAFSASSMARADTHSGSLKQPRDFKIDTNPSPADQVPSSRDLDNFSQNPHMTRTRNNATDNGTDQRESPATSAHQVPISRTTANLPHQLTPKNHPHVGPPSSMKLNSINSNSPPIAAHIKNVSHPPAVDARMRLLSRLEDEKSQARNSASTTINDFLPATSNLDRTFRGHASRSLPATTAPAGIEIDSQMLETKLRTRAQLQVRLAAAKRHNGRP